MKGYSGFKLSTDGKTFCKKAEGNPTALLHQAHKQMKYRGRLLDSPMKYIFDVPKVILKTNDGFCMDYVYGYNIIDVLETCDISTLDTIIERVFNLLDWEFGNCRLRPLKCSAFMNKLSKKCPKEFSEPFKKQVKNLKYRYIHKGICHGDLTFANMIFGDKIYLIDFLSPFIQTPYQDIGKLLQEVDLKWTYHMMDKPVDLNKVNIGYEYLKKQIYKRIEYDDVVRAFHLMTLLRLFPYTYEKKMYDLIYNRVKELIEE